MRKLFITLAAIAAAALSAYAEPTTTAENDCVEITKTDGTETTSPTRLGKVEYKEVDVNGKLRKRYVSGDTVMTAKEFQQYCKVNCPRAYKHVRKAIIYNCISMATCWTLTINWGFLIAGSVQAQKALPAYNEYCAE